MTCISEVEESNFGRGDGSSNCNSLWVFFPTLSGECRDSIWKQCTLAPYLFKIHNHLPSRIFPSLKCL